MRQNLLTVITAVLGLTAHGKATAPKEVLESCLKRLNVPSGRLLRTSSDLAEHTDYLLDLASRRLAVLPDTCRHGMPSPISLLFNGTLKTDEVHYKHLAQQAEYQGMFLSQFPLNDRYFCSENSTLRQLSYNNPTSDMKGIYYLLTNRTKRLAQIFRQEIIDFSDALRYGFVIGDLKKFKRSEEKANADYKGDMYRVTDIGRATVTIENLAELTKGVQHILKKGSLSSARATVIKIKNGFVSTKDKYLDTGFRNVNVKLIVSKNSKEAIINEVQMNLESFEEYGGEGGGGHKLYEILRSKDSTPKQKEAAAAKLKKNHDILMKCECLNAKKLKF
mmetsp:Transcript_2317/g.3365  ORF Transcript_2317/g.3365 Transcript_2317/m.3365 type:complete len:334 (+) Transcript_2317:150-1151(+)